MATLLALWGVVISAVYMLRAYRQIFMGAAPAEGTVANPAPALRWSVIMLLAVLLIGGMSAKSVLNFIQPSVEALVRK